MILFAVLFFLLLLLLGGSYYAYRVAFYVSPHNRGQIPDTSGALYDPYRGKMKEVWDQLIARSYETVTIRSFDGLTLSGRYYHIHDDAPLDICFHGYKSHALTDFSGGSQLCFSLGHNLLLVDQRAHGDSQGNTIAFGILERHDVVSWCEYAAARFGHQIPMTLYGISMGGATVLMASELALPENVKGIVADCPYAVAEDIILEVGKKLHYPAGLIRPFLHLGARIWGGFSLNRTDALRAVKNARLPILILHGDADTFVPCQMSEAVQQANPNMVRRHTIPGAEHGISYLVDTPQYSQIVSEFIQEIIP